MHFDIITIFPEMFAALNYGIVGRAIAQKLIAINCISPHKYSKNRYGSIDDKPYGGGPGMVMMVEPLLSSIEEAKIANTTPALVINLSPQGKRLTQESVKELSQHPHLVLISSRYEGIDERAIELAVDREYSIGDYVLSGGDFAAMAMIDAITRLLPNALGDAESAEQDSFTSGLLDYPHYTRPEVIADLRVPEVLLSGNHKNIATWRLKQALGRTWLRRPELLRKRQLTNTDKMLLNEFLNQL